MPRTTPRGNVISSKKAKSKQRGAKVNGAVASALSKVIKNVKTAIPSPSLSYLRDKLLSGQKTSSAAVSGGKNSILSSLPLVAVRQSLAEAAKGTSSLSDLRDRLLSEKTAFSPVSTSSSLSYLRDKLLSVTSATKKVDPYGLLPSNLTNPGGSSSKASSGRNLSYADQQMSADDQDKIKTYQNNYEMATNDADRQFWHNRANQIRGKYRYTSTDGSGSVKINTDGNEKKSSSWWPIHIPDNATTHGTAPIDFETQRQKQDKEEKDNATTITRYDDPGVGKGSILDNRPTQGVVDTYVLPLPPGMEETIAKTAAEAANAAANGNTNHVDYSGMALNVDFILDNEGKLKNPEDAAEYVAYVAGLDDETKGFLLRTYGAATGDAKLKILNGMLYSAGWTRQTEYLYDSLSPEEQKKLDHMRVADVAGGGNYETGKKNLDEYYAGLKNQKWLDYKKNDYKDDGALSHIVGTILNNVQKGVIAVGDWYAMAGQNAHEAAMGGYDEQIKKIKNDPTITDAEKEKAIKKIEKARSKYLKLEEENGSAKWLDKASQTIQDKYTEIAIDEMALDAMDVSDTTKSAGDFLGVVAQQAPSMVLGMVNPALGLAYLGLSSAGMYSRYALDSGASLDDALAFGLLAGGAEATTEKLFAGFGWFGKGIVGSLAKKCGIKFGMEALNSVSQRILKTTLTDFSKTVEGRFLKRLMAGGGEASEEMIMQLVQPYLERATFNPDAKNSTLKEVAHAGGMGFLVAEFMGIPATATGVYDRVNTTNVLNAVKAGMKDQGYTDAEITDYLDGAKAAIKNDTLGDYVTERGRYAAMPTEARETLEAFKESPYGQSFRYLLDAGIEVPPGKARQVFETYMKRRGGNSGAITQSIETAGGYDSVMAELMGMPVGKLAKRQWEQSLHRDVKKQIKDIQRQYKAGEITEAQAKESIEELTNNTGQAMDVVKGKSAIAGMTTAADSMGVASSGREAIAELKDMAVSRKEGDRISVAFEQNGKTVVYDASVNAYGNLGLISQRDATSKEAAALKEKLATGGKAGLIRIPGGKQGKANNELQLPLPLTSRGMDGTLKLPGDRAFYEEAVSGEGKYSELQIKSIVEGLKGDGFKNNPLRQAYEEEVANLSKQGNDLLKQGTSKKSVARTLNQARRDLGIKYKDATPQPLRNYIYDLNQERYGDPLGPKFEGMLRDGKTYDQIIESASRPNANIDSLLSGFENWLKGQ